VVGHTRQRFEHAIGHVFDFTAGREHVSRRRRYPYDFISGKDIYG
jgi:hypothetical protein